MEPILSRIARDHPTEYSTPEIRIIISFYILSCLY